METLVVLAQSRRITEPDEYRHWRPIMRDELREEPRDGSDRSVQGQDGGREEE